MVEEKYNRIGLLLDMFPEKNYNIATPIYERLLQITDDDYARRICEAIQDDAIEDVYETSNWKYNGFYSEADLKLAIGRIILERMGVEY